MKSPARDLHVTLPRMVHGALNKHYATNLPHISSSNITSSSHLHVILLRNDVIAPPARDLHVTLPRMVQALGKHYAIIHLRTSSANITQGIAHASPRQTLRNRPPTHLLSKHYAIDHLRSVQGLRNRPHTHRTSKRTSKKTGAERRITMSLARALVEGLVSSVGLQRVWHEH